MKSSDLKVGMKAKITSDKDDLYDIAYQKYAGDTVTITSIDGICVCVKENNFNWLPWQLEPITETETVNKFVVKIETEEDGVEALQMFKYLDDTDFTATIRRFMNYYCKERTEDEKTVGIAIENNIFIGWANISFYKENESKFGKIYTLAEIKGYNTKEEKTEKKNKFAVIVKTIEEVIEAFEMFGYPSGTINKRKTAESYLNPFHGTGDRDTLALTITKGKYSGWCHLAFYKENSAEYDGIYTLDEIKADKKPKIKMEEKKMKAKTKTNTNNIPKKKTFNDFIVKTETIERWVKATTIGATPVQDENGKTKGYKKPFVVTTVTTGKGEATVEHSPSNSNEKDAIMYALAKIISKKDDTTKMLYELANSCVVGSAQIYTILANHAVRNGDFNKAYEKYKAIKEYNYAIDCRCKTCGKQFSSPEEAREHERWHALNRKAKHERYLIRREAREKIAEAQHNEAVAAEIKKLIEAE